MLQSQLYHYQLTFKTGGSFLSYFMLTFLKTNRPWVGHMVDGGLSELIGPSVGRFVYWRILSTDVISENVSAICFKQYCREAIKTNDCEIAKPTSLLGMAPVSVIDKRIYVSEKDWYNDWWKNRSFQLMRVMKVNEHNAKYYNWFIFVRSHCFLL